jgi:hypothetical protein
MNRVVAAFLAASLLFEGSLPAACAARQAADPFEVVPLEPPPRTSHRLAHGTLLAGAGLVGISFVLTDRANRSYDRYLAATALDEIGHLYDETVRLDRLSAAALLTGEALIATGVWMRFLRRPAPQRLALTADAQRCAITFRF